VILVHLLLDLATLSTTLWVNVYTRVILVRVARCVLIKVDLSSVENSSKTSTAMQTALNSCKVSNTRATVVSLTDSETPSLPNVLR